MSLVDGNVTVGGGKATTKKTYWYGATKVAQQESESRLDTDRRIARREQLRNIKSATISVYM